MAASRAALDALVAREASGLGARRAARSVGLGAGVALLSLAVAGAVLGEGRWWALPRGTPLAAWVVGGGAALWVARRAWREAAAWVARDRLIPDLERSHGLRDGALRVALEVGDRGVLGRLAADRLLTQLSPAGQGPPATLAAQQARAAADRGLGRAAALGALGLVALLGVTRGAGDGLRATLHPLAAWTGAVNGPLEIEPLPARVPEGIPLSTVIRAPGRPRIVLRVQADAGAWDSTVVEVALDGRARVAVPVRGSRLRLVASDGRGVSDTVAVAVGAAAGVREIAIEARFPQATGRAAEAIALGAPSALPRGTRLRIAAQVVGGIDRVALTDGLDTLWLAEGAPRRAELVVRRSGEWRWLVTGPDATVVDVPPPLLLDVGNDAAPVARILSPGGDTLVTPGDRLPMRLGASDDHGLARVALVVRREGAGATARATVVPVEGAGGQEWTGDAVLALGALSLAPGDGLIVTLVAEDDAVERQRGESAPIRLRVPALSEQREQSRLTGEQLAQRAQALAATQQQLERRTQEAARAAQQATARGAKSMSFEAAEKAKALAQAQRQTSEQVARMADEARRLEQQLKSAGALDTALAQQLRDAQRLMREAMSPDLQQQLAQLERSAQSLDQRQAQASMEQLAEQQRALREQLARGAEMLKRAALEGALSTLRDEAKDVAQAQRQLAERSAGEPAARDSTRRGAPEAQALADRAQKVAQASRQLADRLDQAGAKAGAAKTRAADPQALASAERMRQVADRDRATPSAEGATGGRERPRTPPPGEARGGAESRAGRERDAADTRAAAEAMEQAARQLADAREAQVGAWKNEVGQQLDQAIQELSQLQRAQQQLEQQARQGGDARQLQAEQNALQQGVEKVAQRMEQAGKASSLVSQRTQKAMDEARQRAQQARDALANGAQGGDPSTPGAQGAQGAQGEGKPGEGKPGEGKPGEGKSGSAGARDALKDAADALADAASSLVRDRERLNAAGSASGFSDMIEQMKELAQQQGALNGQLSQMGLTPGGKGEQEGVGVDPKARDAAARQQRAIARALEDVADGDQTGKADALAQEAKALAAALERGTPDPQLLARQQQLYKRMLSAGQFLEQEETDESGKREATPYKGGAPFVPPGTRVDGKPIEPFAAPGWESLKGLSAEERRLVGEYFKRLNAKP
jgi:hypothetical protein